MNAKDNTIEVARQIIISLGLPRVQQNERSALCLLALLNLTPGKPWAEAENPLMGITPIMDWVREHYGKNYAPNTRETFRRQTMHQFWDEGIVLYNPDKPDRPVHSPKAVYQIEPTTLSLLKTFGAPAWFDMLTAYLGKHKTLYSRLLQIELAGFKSISSLSLDLRDINVLIGANGSGKSNLISFFRLLNSLCTMSLQEFIGLAGGANSHLYFGVRQTPLMEGKLTFSSNTGKYLYHLRLAHGAGDRLVFLEESIQFYQNYRSQKTAPIFSLGAGHFESLLPSAKSTVEDKPLPPKIALSILGSLRGWQVFQFHDTSAKARIKQSGYIGDNKFLHADAGNLAAFLLYLRETAQDNYQDIVKTIQRVLPSFKDFVLEPHETARTVILNWHPIFGDEVFGSHQLSDGSLRFMALCTLLLQPKLPSLILLDEPELGLHPYSIELLAGLIRSASTKTQIILSTQSVTLANQFSWQDIVVVDYQNNASVFRRLQEEEVKSWLVQYDIGDLWAKNLIGGTPE
ncbi:MAG: AAA family ATPase [Candidatus Methylumidiphilus sp.]